MLQIQENLETSWLELPWRELFLREKSEKLEVGDFPQQITFFAQEERTK